MCKHRHIASINLTDHQNRFCCILQSGIDDPWLTQNKHSEPSWMHTNYFHLTFSEWGSTSLYSSVTLFLKAGEVKVF